MAATTTDESTSSLFAPAKTCQLAGRGEPDAEEPARLLGGERLRHARVREPPRRAEREPVVRAETAAPGSNPAAQRATGPARRVASARYAASTTAISAAGTRRRPPRRRAARAIAAGAATRAGTPPSRSRRRDVAGRRRERGDERPERERDERERAEAGREPLAHAPDEERAREERDPDREHAHDPELPVVVVEPVPRRQPNRLRERQLDEREPRRLVAVPVPVVGRVVEPEAPVGVEPPVRDRLREAEPRVVLRVEPVDRRERRDRDEREHEQLQARLRPRDRGSRSSADHSRPVQAGDVLGRHRPVVLFRIQPRRCLLQGAQTPREISCRATSCGTTWFLSRSASFGEEFEPGRVEAGGLRVHGRAGYAAGRPFPSRRGSAVVGRVGVLRGHREERHV